LPISTSLGVLGLNGLTAYFALLEIGQPKAGETVVVSTAAGAVGSCAGQIAKIKGCRTVGIAGGPDKVRVCREEFRYDSAVDYRADDFESALDAACPEGVDVYFDNTAGPISDAVMRRLAVGARVVICGTASIASWDPPPQGPRVERQLLVKRARMQGFLIFDHVQRSPEALRDLESWVRDGQIRYREDILDGIEQAPDSIAGLYRGENPVISAALALLARRQKLKGRSRILAPVLGGDCGSLSVEGQILAAFLVAGGCCGAGG
jgi:hypothetical protein